MRAAGDDVDAGAPLLLARSPEVARTLARLLAGEEIERHVVDDRSPWPRYETSTHPRNGRTSITSQSSVHRAGLFGDGPIAETDDTELAHRIAALLNEIDPLPRAKSYGQF